ncbi:MAG: c-type cytochrome, partial [FCB group bacterium]|nr:c-type cytochrome [FCB group bacterium]
MTRKVAKAIFWVGTLSSTALFLLLTWNTNTQVAALTHADKLSSEVVAGKRVFQKYNCNDCHTILGFGGYYAPDLTRVYRRRGAIYIKKVISHPEVMFVNSFRKMPSQGVSPKEINQLVTFFEWVSNIENNDWPPQDSKKRRSSEYSRLLGGTNVSPGAALFKTNGCFNCHKLNGVGGDVGPSLSAIGLKL